MPERSSRPLPLAAVLAVLAPILLVAGLWLGGHPEHLPNFLKEAFVENQSTLVVDEAIGRVARDYYRPVDRSLNFGFRVV